MPVHAQLTQLNIRKKVYFRAEPIYRTRKEVARRFISFSFKVSDSICLVTLKVEL